MMKTRGRMVKNNIGRDALVVKISFLWEMVTSFPEPVLCFKSKTNQTKDENSKKHLKEV